DLVYPNFSTYNEDDQKEEEEEEEKANDDDEVSSNQKVSILPDYEILNEEDNQEDKDKVMGGEQEDEEDEELYEDLNLNLDRRDAKMIDAQINQETKEVEKYVTESLSAKLLTRSSNQPQTAYAIAASLSKFELNKILIDKIK
nr:hypothetical protein [Tanacetum cinerariifolium]